MKLPPATHPIALGGRATPEWPGAKPWASRPVAPRIIGPVDDSQIEFDDRGLVPCIVQDWGTGEVLMHAHMSAESLRRTRETGQLHLFSRSTRLT